MFDFQSFSSSICTDLQKRDEQTLGSLQPRNQVADRRDEPDEERVADFSVVTDGRDSSDDFIVSLDDLNEEITEQWQDTASMTGTSVETISVQSSPPESPVVSPRSEATSDFVRVSSVASSLPAQTARYRRHVNVTLVSCIHRSHQLLHGSNDVSVYLTCLDCRHHAKWTHRTGKHIPAITGVAANGSSVVGKIAATTRMMCWYLLMVGITFCLDRVVHAPNGADACSAGSSFVDTFHVDLWNSRDNVEQRVQRGIRRNRVDLVQLGGQMTNPKDWKHSCQTSWTQKTSRTTTQTRNSVRSSKVTNAGRVLETNDSCSDRAEQEITISSGVCCRLGSGSASSWWKSVSDVSVELERVDYLANFSQCLRRPLSCVLVKEKQESRRIVLTPLVCLVDLVVASLSRLNVWCSSSPRKPVCVP